MSTAATPPKERIRAHAADLGFDLVGFTTLRPSDHAAFYRRWLAEGRHGTMDYLARPAAVEARLDPAARWPELRSAIVVGMNYFPGDDGAAGSRPARPIPPAASSRATPAAATTTRSSNRS